MINAKIVSSLEKIFADEKIENYSALTYLSALRGERVSFQLVYTYTGGSAWQGTVRVPLITEGELFRYATVRRVFNVPVVKPIGKPEDLDDNYLRTSPGLYPDILMPLYYGGKVSATRDVLLSLWFEIEIPRDMPAGEYSLKVALEGESNTAEIKIEVIAAELPDEHIYFTEWFHTDCLAQYYNVPVFSAEYWRIVENFARTAARAGINLLLTPVFTPPLDTAIGGERPTVQLVGVCRTMGEYTFDFSLLDKWIAMCDRVGIKHLEISHLYTQWGAKHAPKIMATADGEYRRIFGWDTDAASLEYVEFLRSFLTALIDHLKKSGNDKRCFFHISDEPSTEHIDSYRAASESISDILEGYPVIDALSSYDFYKNGIIRKPIPASNHIKPFLDADVQGLWTYYCVSQAKDVSNRFMSMPAWRNRSIGMQIYKHNIEGFLHWGYNFYNDQNSVDEINPYLETSADLVFPAGDAYSVYPAKDGTALESPRLLVFYEALQDIRAMKLCERYYGHSAVVGAIEDTFGKALTFETCAKSAQMMLNIRECINKMIKDAVNDN